MLLLSRAENENSVCMFGKVVGIARSGEQRSSVMCVTFVYVLSDIMKSST